MSAEPFIWLFLVLVGFCFMALSFHFYESKRKQSLVQHCFLVGLCIWFFCFVYAVICVFSAGKLIVIT